MGKLLLSTIFMLSAIVIAAAASATDETRHARPAAGIALTR